MQVFVHILFTKRKKKYDLKLLTIRSADYLE